MDTSKIIQSALSFLVLVAALVSIGIGCSAADTTYAEMASEGVVASLSVLAFGVSLYRKIRGLDLNERQGLFSPFNVWLICSALWIWVFVTSLGQLGYL